MKNETAESFRGLLADLLAAHPEILVDDLDLAAEWRAGGVLIARVGKA